MHDPDSPVDPDNYHDPRHPVTARALRHAQHTLPLGPLLMVGMTNVFVLLYPALLVGVNLTELLRGLAVPGPLPPLLAGALAGAATLHLLHRHLPFADTARRLSLARAQAVLAVAGAQVRQQIDETIRY